jgi:multiple sugar transport system substrate-binding protein
MQKQEEHMPKLSRLAKITGLAVGLALGSLALGSLGAAHAEDATITVMTTETSPDTQAAFDKIVAAFEKENAGIKIKFQYVGFQDLNQKLMQALAAGAPPQLITISNQYDLFQLAKQGAIAPVDSIIDTIGRADYFKRFLDANTLDDKVWGIPFSVGVNVLWYRKDLYEASGLKEAKTWDEYLHNVEVIAQASEKSGGTKTYGTALAIGNNSLTNDNTQNWMWSNGATVFNAEGNVTLDQPQAVQSFEYLAKLAKFAPPGANNYSNNEMQNAFVTGAVAHTEYPFRLLSLLEKSAPKLLDVAVPMLHPVGPGQGAHPASFLYVKSWAIAKGAPFQNETARFVKFMETGANKIAVMKSVPVHYWPPLKSVAENPDFLDQPLLKTPAGQRSLKVLADAVNSGQVPLSESGVPVLKLGPVLQKRVIAATLEQIVVNGADPKITVEAAAKGLK